MIDFTFYGSSQFSIYVLDELAKLGFTPSVIVTTPDKPQGRKLVVTPNVVKTWAIEHKIKIYDPIKIDAAFIETLKSDPIIGGGSKHVFVVASYGKILPKALIELPPRKTLNIHPSLLPQYRGASPLQAAILNDTKHTGVTIMRIDEQMDHGPIIAQKEIDAGEIFEQWPTYEIFEEYMARDGARLLASILPDWVAGKITEKAQDHLAATYTKKSSKEDGLIDLTTGNPYDNFRKIQAYHQWPGGYFLITQGSREMKVKVTAASFTEGKLHIEKVIPEGAKEMSYQDFLSGYSKR